MLFFNSDVSLIPHWWLLLSASDGSLKSPWSTADCWLVASFRPCSGRGRWSGAAAGPRPSGAGRPARQFPRRPLQCTADCHGSAAGQHRAADSVRGRLSSATGAWLGAGSAGTCKATVRGRLSSGQGLVGRGSGADSAADRDW